MTLPSPNLDDRRFQDLVNDAKRRVQERCPEWTDHNVSDPGVTLIETVAFMVDQLLYRLNRVPDRVYVKFLELIGVRLAAPVAARAGVTFWLSAPQAETVRVARGTRVATIRSEKEPATNFTVIDDLDIVPASVADVASWTAAGTFRRITDELGFGDGTRCFGTVPEVGDALLIGLSQPVPSCAVSLRFDCSIAEGSGVDPTNPPLVWEAPAGEEWVECELGRDDTGGLNTPGDVVVHVPPDHTVTAVDGHRAAWLRCRVTEASEGQPAYGASPVVKNLTAFTIGGTATAINAEVIEDESLGTAEGHPSERFRLKHRPVVPSSHPVVIVPAGGSDEDGWTQVDGFSDSGENDRHFVLDAASGEVVFGPAVWEQGSLRRFGIGPEKGTSLVVRSYSTGGGSGGNVPAGALKVLKSSIPYVAIVENRAPATGGTDGEDIENAKLRGPLELRGTRAVAARDFEHQALKSAPNEIARVKCLSAGAGADPGAVRVLVVPQAADDGTGRLRFEQVTPLSEPLARKISDFLDHRRVVGVRVSVEPPLYHGITIEATLRIEARADSERVREAALEALYRYFHPISGGPEETGWPFGRPVHSGEVFWVLQKLSGVSFVEEARLYPANPITGQRGDPVERLELEPNALVFSHEHVVNVSAERASSAGTSSTGATAS